MNQLEKVALLTICLLVLFVVGTAYNLYRDFVVRTGRHQQFISAIKGFWSYLVLSVLIWLARDKKDNLF